MALIKHIPDTSSETYLIRISEVNNVMSQPTAIASGDTITINKLVEVLISNISGSFTLAAGTATTTSIQALKKDLTIVTLNAGTYNIDDYILLQGTAEAGLTSNLTFSY